MNEKVLVGSHKKVKNAKFVATRCVFFQPENAQKRFRPGLRPGPRWGSSWRSPRPCSRLRRGTPPRHSPPLRRLRVSSLDLGAFGASLLVPSNTNSWVRPW